MEQALREEGGLPPLRRQEILGWTAQGTRVCRSRKEEAGEDSLQGEAQGSMTDGETSDTRPEPDIERMAAEYCRGMADVLEETMRRFGPPGLPVANLNFQTILQHGRCDAFSI